MKYNKLYNVKKNKKNLHCLLNNNLQMEVLEYLIKSINLWVIGKIIKKKKSRRSNKKRGGFNLLELHLLECLTAVEIVP